MSNPQFAPFPYLQHSREYSNLTGRQACILVLGLYHGIASGSRKCFTEIASQGRQGQEDLADAGISSHYQTLPCRSLSPNPYRTTLSR